MSNDFSGIDLGAGKTAWSIKKGMKSSHVSATFMTYEQENIFIIHVKVFEVSEGSSCMCQQEANKEKWKNDFGLGEEK